MNYEERINELNESLSTCENELENIIDKAVLTGIRADVELVDSNIGYLGYIPRHWKLEKVKYHLSRKSDKNHPDAEVLSLYREFGVVPKNSRDDNHNVTSEDTSKYQFVKIGDFVINKMKAWQGSMAVSGYEGIVSPAYYIYDFKDDTFDKNYFHYLIRNKAFTTEFRRLSGGIREGQWDLPEEAMNNLLLPVPPIEEQREIAEYLDKKCAEIDDVIGDIKAQIESLSKMRLSMISETITRGLNPNVEYKDSGIVWLGQIPAHWHVLKNKYIFDISKVIVENPENYQLLSLTTKGIREKDENDTGGKVPENYNTYQVVVPNDIVMCLFDLDCSAVFSGLSPYRGMISPAYKILKTKNGVAIPEYMQYVFMHAFSGRHYKQYSKSLRFTVNADEFGTLFTIVPPIEEQREIAEYLDKKCAEIDDVIGDKEKQLDVLEEYKKSLIFEVVTGKRGV